MARVALRHAGNAAGDWFVDDRCIDCGTCQQGAPTIFADLGGQAVVARQPSSAAEEHEAWLAAQACPTQSIGTASRRARPGRLYPHEIRPGTGVFDCGYCSPDSFGATAWFVRRSEGNILVDSPRFTMALVAPLRAMGGIDEILLTHSDDVADARRWADEFGATVRIHRDDAWAAPFVTEAGQFRGDEPVVLRPGWVMHPLPGHTKGSVAYLLEDRYLFTGDSLAWSHARQDLVAFRDACWWSWTAQADALERLCAARFAWVLPGHGARVEADPQGLHERLEGLVARMRLVDGRRSPLERAGVR